VVIIEVRVDTKTGHVQFERASYAQDMGMCDPGLDFHEPEMKAY